MFKEEMDDLHIVAQAMDAAGNHDEGVFYDALKYYRAHGELDGFDFTVDYQDAMLRAYEAHTEARARYQDEWFEEECAIREEFLDEERLAAKSCCRAPIPDYPEGEEPF